jgi:hypothetical protein
MVATAATTANNRKLRCSNQRCWTDTTSEVSFQSRKLRRSDGNLGRLISFADRGLSDSGAGGATGVGGVAILRSREGASTGAEIVDAFVAIVRRYKWLRSPGHCVRTYLYEVLMEFAAEVSEILSLRQTTTYPSQDTADA